MPTPRDGESEDDFVGRGVGFVMREGTAKNPAQAAAICHSIWKAYNRLSPKENKKDQDWEILEQFFKSFAKDKKDG